MGWELAIIVVAQELVALVSGCLHFLLLFRHNGRLDITGYSIRAHREQLRLLLLPWLVIHVFGHYLVIGRRPLSAPLAAASEHWLVVFLHRRSLRRFLAVARRSDLFVRELLVGVHVLLRPISLRLLLGLFVISFTELDHRWVVVKVFISALTTLPCRTHLSILAFYHISAG